MPRAPFCVSLLWLCSLPTSLWPHGADKVVPLKLNSWFCSRKRSLPWKCVSGHDFCTPETVTHVRSKEPSLAVKIKDVTAAWRMTTLHAALRTAGRLHYEQLYPPFSPVPPSCRLRFTGCIIQVINFFHSVHCQFLPILFLEISCVHLLNLK